MNEAYLHLAGYYDRCVNADYSQWIEYLLSLFLRFGPLPKTILDLGCGTGNMTIGLAKRGYRVTGVDLSPEMVSAARKKARESDLDLCFFVQDLRFLELPDCTFDSVICTCDVLNYLTSAADLVRAFRGVQRVLRPGGLWLFDLNSAQKLQDLYGDRSYAELQRDFAYFWDNSYDRRKRICQMELTLFVGDEKGHYRRVKEIHRQKLWLPGQIKRISAKTGFSFRACYDFPHTRPCSNAGRRWQFVLSKAK